MAVIFTDEAKGKLTDAVFEARSIVRLCKDKAWNNEGDIEDGAHALDLAVKRLDDALCILDDGDLS